MHFDLSNKKSYAPSGKKKADSKGFTQQPHEQAYPERKKAKGHQVVRMSE